ncbi:MAG: hypothetical protein D6729_06405 [Deltaproteobacteria bacterium]|nr:MAG: hypothetical protein D6729_06405 [Deltaproteobacteria bacterium]
MSTVFTQSTDEEPSVRRPSFLADLPDSAPRPLDFGRIGAARRIEASMEDGSGRETDPDLVGRKDDPRGAAGRDGRPNVQAGDAANLSGSRDFGPETCAAESEASSVPRADRTEGREGAAREETDPLAQQQAAGDLGSGVHTQEDEAARGGTTSPASETEEAEGRGAEAQDADLQEHPGQALPDEAPDGEPAPQRPITAAELEARRLEVEAAPNAHDAWSERLAAALSELRATSRLLAEQARSDAIEIGLMVARRILEGEVATRVDTLFSLVKSAIRRAGESRIIEVRLHPEDLRRLESVLDVDQDRHLEIASLRLIGDATLARGDVVVEAEFGTIDARLETRLDQMRQALEEVAGEAPEGEAR